MLFCSIDYLTILIDNQYNTQGVCVYVRNHGSFTQENPWQCSAAGMVGKLSSGFADIHFPTVLRAFITVM